MKQRFGVQAYAPHMCLLSHYLIIILANISAAVNSASGTIVNPADANGTSILEGGGRFAGICDHLSQGPPHVFLSLLTLSPDRAPDVVSHILIFPVLL